jgi:peptide deformylase
MIYNLVPCDHPILHSEVEKFDFDNPPIDPIELSNNLIETMAHYRGLGLSANQCGLPYRVFVMWSEVPLACFNPRIIDESTEQVQLEEGCLSYPQLLLPIKRAKIIKVRFQDHTGEVRTDKFIGMTARCYQHELDHLNGVDYTRRASSFHLSRGLRKQKVLLRKQKGVIHDYA